MDKHLIGIRTQDFQDGLKETKPFGPKESYFGKTLLVGKAAILAMHIKGLLYIDSYISLQYAAAELGISSVELPIVLRKLEEVDFVSVVGDQDNPKRVEVRVPEFRDGYEELGELWEQQHPTDVERAGIETLNSLITAPIAEQELQQLGLSSTEYSSMFDVMQSGQLLRLQTISGTRLAYTPLAVDENPEKYLKWSQNYDDDEIGDVLKLLTNYQGMPQSSPQVSGKSIVQQGVLSGVFMPVKIKGATGEQGFIFAPKGGLKPEERVILDKARAILACVRYGEHFAAGVPIKYPQLILQQLRDHKQFKRGHSDLNTQYSLLATKGIGRPFKLQNGRWNFKINDTPENLKALDVAAEMLTMGDTPTTKTNMRAYTALFAPTQYTSPLSSRTILANSIQSSEETMSDVVEKVCRLMRGSGGFE